MPRLARNTRCRFAGGIAAFDTNVRAINASMCDMGILYRLPTQRVRGKRGPLVSKSAQITWHTRMGANKRGCKTARTINPHARRTLRDPSRTTRKPLRARNAPQRASILLGAFAYYVNAGGTFAASRYHLKGAPRGRGVGDVGWGGGWVGDRGCRGESKHGASFSTGVRIFALNIKTKPWRRGPSATSKW